jgi:hypothetical protein
MPSGMCEVLVCAQERQLVPNAQLRQQRVDGADLHTRSSASVAQHSGGNVILAIGLKQRKRGKTLDDLSLSLRPRESLKQLLQHQASRHYNISAYQRVFERVHRGLRGLGVTSQCQRPNAGVHHQRHVRDRSAL